MPTEKFSCSVPRVSPSPLNNNLHTVVIGEKRRCLSGGLMPSISHLSNQGSLSLSHYPSSSSMTIVSCETHCKVYAIPKSFPPSLTLLALLCPPHQVDWVTWQEEFACANTQVKLALFSVPMEMPGEPERECVAPVNKTKCPRFVW